MRSGVVCPKNRNEPFEKPELTEQVLRLAGVKEYWKHAAWGKSVILRICMFRTFLAIKFSVIDVLLSWLLGSKNDLFQVVFNCTSQCCNLEFSRTVYDNTLIKPHDIILQTQCSDLPSDTAMFGQSTRLRILEGGIALITKPPWFPVATNTAKFFEAIMPSSMPWR